MTEPTPLRQPEPAGQRPGPSGQQVLYRKWRPLRFADVAGQDPVTTTLRNAVAVAAPAHAYLFAGPRGTGKTSTARILARAVNCEAPVEGEPCNECQTCVAFLAGEPLDLIELDAASNRGIDEVRQLRESVGISPNRARYKVYLIDEAHMLTEPAFNALLKTLEEPPPHVIFVLATTERRKLPATIVSRCQHFDFRRIPLEATVERVREVAAGEGITLAEGGSELIARQATGSLRDAVNLLDQIAAYHGHELSLDAVRSALGLVVDDRAGALARAATTRDLAAGLGVLAAARDDGIEIRAFLKQVLDTLRSALLLKAGGGQQLALSDTETEELEALARDVTTGDIVAALRALGEVDFGGDAYDSLPAEIAFATLAVAAEAPADIAPAAEAPATAAPAAEAPAASAPAPAQRQRGGQGARPAARRDTPPAPPRPPRASPSRAPADAPSAPVRQARARLPSPPPDEGEVSAELAGVRDQWEQIRETARKHNHRAGAMLNSQCFVKRFEDDRLEIGFKSASLVEKTLALEEGAVMRSIQEAVSEVVGRTVEVVPVLWEELQHSSSPSGGTPSATSPAAGGHLTDEAVKLGAERIEE